METDSDMVASELNRGEMVVSELNRGEGAGRKLLEHIDSGCSMETCRKLTLEMMSSFEKSIQLMVTSGGAQQQVASCPNSGGKESLQSLLPKSPRNENKKRKTLRKWSSQVSLLGSVVDGYSWRKYGQKEILGAKNPRSYYRCTHRHSQGCPAMKQVQRSDQHPSLFDITYRGTHTCQLKVKGMPPPLQKQDMLLSLQNGLKVKTEGLDFQYSQEPSSSSLSFSFPSTPVDLVKTEKVNSSPSSTLDNSFAGGLSSAFISPTTSESNYFQRRSTFRAAESEFTEYDSAETSASNFPLLDMDFLLDLDKVDFPFDSSFLSENF